MSRNIAPGRGNKRKVRQIRWTWPEIITAILLLLVFLGETICIALWLTGHSFD